MKTTTLPNTFGRLVLGLLSLLCVALISTPASAQDNTLEECAGGTLFYVAYPDTVTNAQDSRFADRRRSEFFLYIYSPVNQQVKIGRANGASSSKNIIGGDILEFDTREIAVPLISVRNAPQSNVLKIESESPVVVYAYMASPFGCAAFTPIPVESWGTEYYAATWEGEFVRDIQPAGENNFDASVKVPAPAEILVVAAYDNTQVRINPTGPLAACANCQTVKLNAGEAYLVQSFVDLGDEVEHQSDIGGSSITANKRIGVVTGNTRIWHESFADGFLGANSYKDLVAEWIAPVEQHGTEFVFMPTWDDLRQRPNVTPVRENEYVRVFATTNKKTEIGWYNTVGILEPGQSTGIKNGEYSHERLGVLSNAIEYTSSDPSQAYQSPRPVTEFGGTTGSGSFIGARYLSHGGSYMVEMVPREQWVSYSPFKAPSYPSGMKHYINIVTDTNNQFNVYYRSGSGGRQLFPFSRGKVPGTDLIWGQIIVNPGLNYIIESDDDGRFGGFVYGQLRGYELYRPGGTEKDDDDKSKSVAGGGDNDLPGILHPSEYEEELAMMYGYPLAPSRCVLAEPDKYNVTVEQDCDKMVITIEAENENPSGLKFIRLLNDRDSTFNTRLEFIEPESALALREKNVAKAVIQLVAINPLQDARGVVEFKDRTREGKVQRVRFKYEAERVDIVPAEGLDFGQLTLDFAAGERELTITNPLDKDVVVKELKLFFGNQEFVITRVEPNFDWKSGKDSIILKSKESMKVWIDITPRDENRIYHDSLVVILGCVQVSVPLDAATVQPCLFVNDLDFGTLAPKDSKTLELEICNIGKGRVTFHDSTSRGGGDILTWLLTNKFTVDPADIQKLRTTVLNANECVKINVTFSSDSTGTFRTVSRFWASTRDCRDTSIWRAKVTSPGPQITSYDWLERWLSSRNPCTKNGTEQYEWDIEVSNDGDAPFTVVEIKIVEDPDGVFEIINPGNVTPNKSINPNVTEKVRVAFRPMEEKPYSAVIRLYFRINGELDSLDGFLDGVGLESYVEITDQAYSTLQFKGPGNNPETKSLFIRSTGTRPVTITGASIKGPDGTDFGNLTFLAPNLAGPTFTLAPGEVQEIEVTFNAQDTDPLLKNATVDLEGDFAYANCSTSKTDSSGTITGEVYTLGAEVTGWTFPNILTCYEDDGVITVTNTGTDPIEMTNIGQPQPISDPAIFSVDDSGFPLPFTIAPGETVQIPVHFSPVDPQAYTASVDITFKDLDGDGTDDTQTAIITGSARKISINFSIEEGYSTFPGLPLTISVNMNGMDDPDFEPSQGQITHFFVQVYYNAGMMLVNEDNFRLGEAFPEGDGWKISEFERQPGYIIFEIQNTQGKFIERKEGKVLEIDFVTYIGDTLATELRPEAWLQPGGFGANGNDCIDFTFTPGDARLDSVCGLNFRLIEATNAKYSVGNAYPNVANTQTDVEFSLGLDAHTTIELFNQQGDKVGVLVDEYLNPGTYRVTWDVRGLPTGTYYYRINSGHWTGTQEVRVQK